ncbi:MAG: response regulator [Alphaproteobacteria bacterium]|nr:response regulator [Alphaproteobacteria bacterium]
MGKTLGFRVKGIVLLLLGLLILIFSFSYASLRQSTDQVNRLAEGALPSLAATMELSLHLEGVIQSSERLMNASIQAERRVAYEQTREALAAGSSFLAANSTFASSREMEEIFATLSTATDDLNTLIDEKMRLASDLDAHRLKLSQWFGGLKQSGVSNTEYALWLGNVGQMLGQMAILTPDMNARLMRREISRIGRTLRTLEQNAQSLSPAARSLAAETVDNLQDLISGDMGIFAILNDYSRHNLRAKALTRQMRVITSEMLRDLNAITKGEITETQASAHSLVQRSESQLTALILVVVAAMTLAVLAFIYVDQRVIQRLGRLQRSVKDRADGHEAVIPVTGDDEITEISKAVQYFVDEIDRRQQSLIQSAEQVRDIILQSPQPMCVAAEGIILFHNAAFENLWTGDIELSDVPAYLPSDLLASGDDTRQMSRHEIWMMGHEPRWFDMASSPANWEGVHARQLILVDVSSQVKVEKTLKGAKEKAEAAAQAKSSFLAMMSHEIRSPMNGIISVAEILSKENMGQEQQRLLSVINQSAETLLTIINDILDFSKIEAGKLAIENLPFNLPDLVRSAAELLAGDFKQKSITFEIDIDQNLPDEVMGDANRLRQILFNLISNAAKFTADGSVRVSAKKSGDKVQISVEDTGIGISPDMLERLFQPFEQADTSTARQFGGTGLGLSICKQLASLMGGNLGVTSTVGKGSVFTVTLPLNPAGVNLKAKTDIALQSKKRAHQPAAPSAKRHILVVEDNPINQVVITKILSQLSCSYDVAGDGIEALGQLENNRYDLILTDLRMPNMDGFAMARTIREREQEEGERLPIVAVSADAMEEARQESQKSGIDDFISKPIKIDEVRACLETHLPAT